MVTVVTRSRAGAALTAMAQSSGLERPDIGALNPEQQERLRQFKIKTRIANETYVRSHPEVELLLSEFLREVFLKRPVDIREFAADHFTDPDLPDRVRVKLEKASE